MTEELKAGLTHEMERQTTEDMSAQKVFPHVPDVYATRVMVGHFEEVCCEMVLPLLGEGEQTVGIGWHRYAIHTLGGNAAGDESALQRQIGRGGRPQINFRGRRLR